MAVNIFKLTGEIDVQTGRAEANLKRVDQAAKKTQAGLSQADAAGKKAGQGIASGFDRGASSASRLSSAVSALSGKLSSLKSPNINIGGGSGGFGGIGNLVKGNLISGAISSALGGVTDKLQEGWSAGIEYNKMLEKANISFTTLLGSTAKAQEHLKSLQAFGEATPFEFGDLIKASQRMQAMGFAAKDIIPTLRNVGDAVSAVGGGKEELDGVVLALGQMQTKGKVSAEEMNQLAERGIPAWDLLAKAIGKTKAETIKLSEQGRLSGPRAVEGITAMMGERFGGQMGKMSGTLAGRESNFNDILQRQLGAATQGNFDQLKAAYEKATIGLGTTGAQAFGGELNKMLTDVGKLAENDLQKLATGETFTKGAKTVAGAGALASKVGALADKTGVTKNAIGAGQSANELLFGDIGNIKDPVDKAVFGGIKSALQMIGVLGKEEGTKAGDSIGQGIQDGAKANLQIQSPSKVMMMIGEDAAIGFQIGFESGKRKIGSVVDAEELKKKTLAELEKLREDPRIKAMLDTIAKAEGTGASYNMQFGGGKFSSLAGHPNDPVTRKMGGKSITSTAAGRYQFLNRTWSGLENQLGLPDFSAKSQDLGAIQLMKSRGMIDPILKGDISGALTKGNREWASLPGSPYGQPTKKAEELVSAYNVALEKYNGLMGETSSLMTSLNFLYDAAAVKLSSLTDAAMQFIGMGGTAPKVAAGVIPQRPSQTITGGGMSVDVKAPAEVLALSKDAAAATVQMQVPLRELPSTTAAVTEALKSTETQAGKFADAIMEAGSATKEAVDHLSHFKDAFAGGFDQMFDDLLDGQKVSLKSFGKQLLKGGISSLISSATGGAASSPGGMLSNMLFGGAGGSGGGGMGSGGGVPATGGFAGGGGANDILGKAQGIGGLFKKGGMLSKMPGLGKVGGLLGKIPGMAKLGSLFGGGGAAAGAAGGAGAAAGGAGGIGGLLGGGGMAAMFSNPVTGAIAAGLIAAPFIAKLFGKDPLADYRKHIKGEYGVDVKSKTILGKVLSAGQSKFGADAPKRVLETVRLPEVRDMISEYAQGYMLNGANSKLFSGADIDDQYSAMNQIKVKMLNGGKVPGAQRGYDHIPVLMDGGEQVISNSDQRKMKGGGWTGKAKEEYSRMTEIAERMIDVLSSFKPADPGKFYEIGATARPNVAARQTLNTLKYDNEARKEARGYMAGR